MEKEQNKSVFDGLGDTKQAAELWGLTKDTVKHLCQQGEIHAQKFGNSWVVDLSQPNPKKYRKNV